MYKFNAKVKKGTAIVTHKEMDNADFLFEMKEENGLITAYLTAKTDLRMQALELETEKAFAVDDLFYANGYQSWSTSREFNKYGLLKDITPLGKKLGKFATRCCSIMGDYEFADYGKTGCFHSYTYTYFRKKNSRNITLYGSKTERQGFTIFKVDMPNGKFIIKKDIEGLMLRAGEKYEVFNIAVIEKEYDAAFDEYFYDFMGCKKPRISHLAGYTSWYNYFEKISEDICLRDLDGMDRAKECVDIFQIDDGYQTATGDWLSTDKKKFPHGMKYIADKIHEKGYLAGIWIAPFCAQMSSKVLKEHPDWMIVDEDNGKKLFGHIGWGGAYTLDIYHPEAREYIKSFFHTILNEWGYDMVKLDFLFTQCERPRAGKTRGQIMCEGVDLLREACGDKLILGCGIPLGPCMGIFDACRIGCDVHKSFGGDWLNKLAVNNEIPSTQNSLNNAVFRNHLDGRVFCNDPDVFFLRNNNLDFNLEQKLVLGKVNAVCGNVLFVSDNAGDYSEETLGYLKKFFTSKDYKVTGADYIDNDTIRLAFTEDGKEKVLTFDIYTGASNINECM